MEFNNSTNILRDESSHIDYIVTPNTKEIFSSIFLSKRTSNRSFTLIGNYGTGKSTFVWALEKNLTQEKNYFTTTEELDTLNNFEFIKLVGDKKPLSEALKNTLEIDDSSSSSILDALESKRVKAENKNNGIVLVIDEFGKFLEFATENTENDEVYLIQQIAEWANDRNKNVYFIITLHQSFLSYGRNLPLEYKQEWEKVKGRFIDIVFNEPVEQLLYFASKKLDKFIIPKSLNTKHKNLINLIEESNLVSAKFNDREALYNSIFPLDWLSANILVRSLQRYGQNERSLFTFLSSSTKSSIHQTTDEFYSVSKVYDYLVHSLPTEINSIANPHRAQWLTTYRAIEKAELYFDENFDIVSDILKTIGLVNLFSREGGLFDENFLIKYFQYTKQIDVHDILDKLKSIGIIRFYIHSNKINFLEGTDLDLEQELLIINKDINNDFSIANEITGRVEFPVFLAKRYSFETGTNRFFEFRILDSLKSIKSPIATIDGYINLIFFEATEEEIKKKSKEHNDNLFVKYQNVGLIRENISMILKLNKLIEKFSLDINALKILKNEKRYYTSKLNELIIDQLFVKDKNTWIYKGAKIDNITNRHNLYEKLTDICFEVYYETPSFINELINKENLSAPINRARRALFRQLLESESLENIGFPENRFPAEKSIYESLLKNTQIHIKEKDFNHYKLDKPKEGTALYDLWVVSENFVSNASQRKVNLKEFYDFLSYKPYKLKRGFLEFWIPIFLIANKEEYALFHKEGGFIPYLTEDTLDFIHRRPQDFSIKGYDISGLKINLLESYKELVQLNEEEAGPQSTFFSIYGNFLRFHRNLNNYSLKTMKLSSSAIKLREAIVKSEDPEDALFNQFPNALGYQSFSIKDDVDVLSSYIKQIKDAIKEIRTAFEELLNRIEHYIIESFHCSSSNFEEYKDEIAEMLQGLNHALLTQNQTVFYKRLVSPLDDRNSWLKSVADVALGKNIDNMLDEEEVVLKNSITDLSLGLIKSTELQKYNQTAINSKIYSIRLFNEDGSYIDNKLVIKREESESLSSAKSNVKQALNKLNEEERKELLFDLLSKEINI